MSGGGGSSTTRNNIPDQLIPLANSYVPKAIAIGDRQFTPYTGQRFAGTNADQNAAFGQFRSQAQQGSGLFGQGAQALSGLLNPQGNPYLDAMVGKAQGNIVDQYNNVIRPQQDVLSARSGAFGNSGVDATINQQQKQLLGQLGDVSTSMYGSAYNSDRQLQSQAVNQAQAYSDPSRLLSSGLLQQQQAQQPLDFNFQQFQEAQNQPYKNLSAMGAPFSQNMGGSSQTTAQRSTDWGQLGLAAAMMYFSDKRLKKDIKKVGETDEGLGIFTYKYKGDDKPQIGVMAQEVQRKKPEAVRNVGGLLMVDYSKV